MSNDATRDLMLYERAERAAKTGDVRAIGSLERLNKAHRELIAADTEHERAKDKFRRIEDTFYIEAGMLPAK